MIGTPGKTHSAWRHLIGPAPLGVLAARHRLLAAARAQPIYEPSCRQACDDHAHADEHINENDGNAAVDVHGGPNLEPLLFDDKRRLIPGGYRSSYRMVAIWQLDRLDDLGAALSSPGGRMAELSVLSNCARAVSVEQVKQVREIVRDFYHGSASLPLVSPQPRAVESGWVEPTLLASWKPPGDKYIDMLLTDADRKERIARSFPR